MKNNIRSFFNHSDMFHRTQWRLTATYSGILIVFLAIFIAVVSFLIHTVMTNDQERRIRMLAEQEGQTIQTLLTEQPFIGWPTDQNVIFLSEDQLFFYVVDARGRLMMGDEVNKGLRPLLLSTLQPWTPEKNELRYVDIHIPHHQHELKRFRADELKILTVARPLIVDRQLVGVLYVGMDVTSMFRLLKWSTFILLSLGVLFIAVAVAFSYFMSKRALVPIQDAYNRQRQFVADASHELRTPLSVIFSSVEALKMDMSLTSDAFSRKTIERLGDETKRMTKLINDLLTLARTDDAKLQIEKKPFDLQACAQHTLHSLQELANKKNITLQFHASEQIEFVGDEDKCTQLLYILLDNAIKYTPEGGTVSLSFKQYVTKQRKVVEISISDTGIGIAPEHLPHIFDRFYRADKARTRQIGGHGLGLSIAKWIVEAHNGHIQVESEVGKGTTFTLTFPNERA
ncbi:two-component sensor histidine kinase [Anoxybacillus ayderensis]|uniref:sensor histidine kinase n=1 Tax=Anoxybacillus sp. ST70 TaxID=2864180 RepID=UPI0004753835|nr:ATP-binding protein [Anoxybacillus sp. ST70]AXM88626.1 two-component sensor histidine kinase [Anoxybacillus ayderensis G10]MBW9219169.1 two-component sensor histidine kinase [Anoxybacillus sp. ST70]THD17054.1 two-component sensor histidine kinase [Anoxybacillus ayderensis]